MYLPFLLTVMITLVIQEVRRLSYLPHSAPIVGLTSVGLTSVAKVLSYLIHLALKFKMLQVPSISSLN